MSGEAMSACSLAQQLMVARSEINNLRQQLRALGCSQAKEIEKVHNLLESMKCPSCQELHKKKSEANYKSSLDSNQFPVRPIGLISSWFPEKKATPRQPGICVTSRGKLTLSGSVFTNPEHALEGLEEFSHMWILYYFHKNEPSHVHAKVTPPRLNGVRMGVFCTRSPHRPSPIGLSLVKIERVEGNSVYFTGVDMVDGTPVLDIKPYIPMYDNPLHTVTSAADHSTHMEIRDADVPGSSGSGNPNVPAGAAAPPVILVESVDHIRPDEQIGEREAPDGEEGTSSQSTSSMTQQDQVSRPPESIVRVPSWIAQPPVAKLTVNFSDRAKAQLENIISEVESAEGILNAIKSVLREDPRSVYLREKWGNQFYTFLICNMHVSCKFDDALHCVTVFQVRSAAKVCECGQLEWQCSIHNDVGE